MSDSCSSPAPRPPRIVVIGRNSVLWSRIGGHILEQRPDTIAVGHRDIAKLRLTADDCVWIFSYAPSMEANRGLFGRIAALGAGQHVYLSSATANIADRARCYRYPRIKAQGEKDAAAILGAASVRIGLIHDDPAELPAGVSVATRLDDLVSAMTAGEGDFGPAGHVVHLHQLIERPFPNAAERAAYRGYGRLLRQLESRPCVLRPLDLVLRTIGWRWYGYFRLSNEQCLTTTLS